MKLDRLTVVTRLANPMLIMQDRHRQLTRPWEAHMLVLARKGGIELCRAEANERG